jgi:adenylate cyclase
MGAMKRTYQPNITKKWTYRLQFPAITLYALTITACIIVLFIFSQFTLKMQSDLLYQEKIQAGKIRLSHFVNNAAMPLLDNDVLSLNVLMKEAKSIDGVLYVAIVDNKGTVKAHTDIGKIGSTFGKFEKSNQPVRDDGTVMVTYQIPDGTRVLDLSRPVNFMKNRLGEVHVGLSFIDGEVKKEMSGLIRDFVLLGLVLLEILLCSALALLFWLRKVQLYGPTALSDQSTENEQLYSGDEAAAITSCGSFDDTTSYSSAGPHGLSMSEMNQNHVTVLFAGIKGFKAYAEINDHQKLMEDLNDYLSLATVCIKKYGGYIDKFVGASIVAVFGNAAHEANHTERALNAAVAMQKALQDSGKNGNPLLLKVGIGITSGVVLSGCIGLPAQKEHVFIGESIKMAYSLNVMAGPGEIVMSRDAYRMIEHLVTVEPMPPREVMRRTEPWENFRLLKMNKFEG